jgi:hypothetical protein
MANRLKMAEHQAIIGLARLNWSYRRIAAELGVDRQTVSRHVKAVEAKPSTSLGDPPGVGPPAEGAARSAGGKCRHFDDRVARIGGRGKRHHFDCRLDGPAKLLRAVARDHCCGS